MPTDPTQRFSDRVGAYLRYRPSYPAALVDVLASQLSPDQPVADIGSGTGIFTHLLLARGARVWAVEPNTAMRSAAEDLLGSHPHFRSVTGSAEQTGLPDQSVAGIVAAQAFHWFDRGRCRSEFRRILQPGSWVALVWNDRTFDTPFAQAYEAFLLRYATDYTTIDHRQIDPETIADFLGGQVETQVFDYEQIFDAGGLAGRYLSCSYALPATHPAYDKAIQALADLHATHAQAGLVAMRYQTRLHFARW
ncbi:MAG: class I SAM-dependent methyltransferase [Bacteroidia bacterium]